MNTEIRKTHKGEITLNDVQDKIISIQNKNVLLDSDVAWLYGVETKRVNEAVKNNPDKFPQGYVIELKNSEFYDLRSKFSTTNLEGQEFLRSKFSTLEKTRVLPKAFTEKGLYMLATIKKEVK